MKNATFLVLQGLDGTTADLGPLAETAYEVGGRLNVLHIGPVPVMSYSIMATPYGAPIVPDGWLDKRNEVLGKLSEKQEQTRAYLTRQELTGEVGTLCVEPTAFNDLVAKHALFADYSIVQNSLRAEDGTFDNVVYGLLFDAPGPVILNTEERAKALAPDHVLVAWNNSLQSARAVRAALPLLTSAKEVTIGCFDPNPSEFADGESPGADLATWLSHHGCNVTVQEYASGHDSVGHAIMKRAGERTADLVVMGAYGRSRWNERIFGGTTETLLDQTDLPVLMSH